MGTSTGLQKSQQEVAAEAVKLVRETIGPVAAFRKVLFVKGLPKTRSGKIPRSALADLVNGKPYKVGQVCSSVGLLVYSRLRIDFVCESHRAETLLLRF